MTLLEQIKEAGIVGCGGAGFPTHVKLNCTVEYLIINAAECEPLLRTDRFLMLHKAREIVTAAGMIGDMVQAGKRYIALKETYSEEIAALEAAITTVAAFILAYGLHLTRIPGKIKEGLQLVVMMPMFLPSITYGFAVIYSFGKQGLITKLVGEQLFPIYGFWGLLISFIVYTLPPAFLVLYNAFFYIDKNFITVSKIMGDSQMRTLWMTSVRPLLGSLMAAFILSFFLSFTDFGIPVSIGGEYDMIAVELYMKMMGALPDFERGSVIAMAMLVPSVISVMLLRYMEKFNFRYNKSAVMRCSAPLCATVLSACFLQRLHCCLFRFLPLCSLCRL